MPTFTLTALPVATFVMAFGAGAGCSHLRSSEGKPSSDDQAAPAAVSATSAPAKAEGEVAILAGGCFWGMEDILRKVPGVLDTEVGYTGPRDLADNDDRGLPATAAKAESVRIVFDPAKLTYDELLDRWFFRMHDPTTKFRQGNDVGAKYRSAIFVLADAQRRAAIAAKAKVDASGRWPRPAVTEIVQAGAFEPAEESHQDYLVKHPGGYTCHWLRE